MYTVNFILDKVSNSKWGSQSSKHYKLLNGASTIKNTPTWAIWFISFLIGSNPNNFFNTSNRQFWKERLIWNIKKIIFYFDTKSRIPPIVAPDSLYVMLVDINATYQITRNTFLKVQQRNQTMISPSWKGHTSSSAMWMLHPTIYLHNWGIMHRWHKDTATLAATTTL